MEDRRTTRATNPSAFWTPSGSTKLKEFTLPEASPENWLSSHRKLASVLPKVGEDTPEEGGDHGQGAHQVFGVPLVK